MLHNISLCQYINLPIFLHSQRKIPIKAARNNHLQGFEALKKRLRTEIIMELFIAWSMRVVSAALILIGGYMIGNWLSKRIKGIEQLDQTLAGFLGGFAKYAVFTVALVTVLGQFGVQTASLLAVLGAAGLAIGLALQGTLSNVAAGVMMLLIRPFNVGDFIDFGGTSGTVKSLGLFGTELAAADNVYIYAPNSEI